MEKNFKNVRRTFDEMITMYRGEGRPLTTSHSIASCFGLKHYELVKHISKLEHSAMTGDFAHQNFERIGYRDQKGVIRPAYLVSYDGYQLLTMGYNSPKAGRAKEAFERRFAKSARA